jgi:hypothetical protein
VEVLQQRNQNGVTNTQKKKKIRTEQFFYQVAPVKQIGEKQKAESSMARS